MKFAQKHNRQSLLIYRTEYVIVHWIGKARVMVRSAKEADEKGPGKWSALLCNSSNDWWMRHNHTGLGLGGRKTHIIKRIHGWIDGEVDQDEYIWWTKEPDRREKWNGCEIFHSVNWVSCWVQCWTFRIKLRVFLPLPIHPSHFVQGWPSESCRADCCFYVCRGALNWMRGDGLDAMIDEGENL